MEIDRELYEELILDHNRQPRNYPLKPIGCNHSGHGFNPFCGDEFDIHLTVKDGVIEAVGFEGAGCAISTASASMMTEAIKGKRVEEVEALFEDVHRVLASEGEDERTASSPLLGKLAVIVGVKDYPMRVKCATLAWHTMMAALKDEQETVCTEDVEHYV